MQWLRDRYYEKIWSKQPRDRFGGFDELCCLQEIEVYPVPKRIIGDN